MRIILLLILSVIFPLSSAIADKPRDWQWNFQEPVTEVMSDIINLHNSIMIILTIIVIIVMGLLAYVWLKFNKKSNPVPAKFSHNLVAEITWTIIPVIILCVIAVPSFKLLKKVETIPPAELTVKVVGHQWYWSYYYPDYDSFGFDSYMIPDDQVSSKSLRLLEVDNRVVIPENTVVRFLVTAADVLHSFAIPSFGIKMDAVPGRVNETWAKVTKKGVYYGQCSELCGANHGFMPIAIEVVSKEDFDIWVQNSKQKFGANKDLFRYSYKINK